MSAPLIWVGVPLLAAAILSAPWRPRTTAVIGGLCALSLAILAFLTPINEALRIGETSFKIEPVFRFLGRQLVLKPESKSLLVFIYGLAGLWFLGSDTAGIARRMVPLSLVITALLVAALAVQPFLYAALLIEMAILLAVPMLTPARQAPARGVIRFVIYQTLAMPFILFSGWLLSGVEASPGDLILARQSTVLLGLGFAFLLAVFPLYTWMPMLAEESQPYIFGFLQWIMPITALLFGMGFLDRYAWLRSSEQLPRILHLAGLIMTVSAGLWAAFQHRLDRILAYGVVAETGCALLSLSLGMTEGIQIIFRLLIPRAFGLAVWSLGLSVLKNDTGSLKFTSIQGATRAYPFAVGAVILAQFSMAGLPLLAGFPPRLVLWEALASNSIYGAFWFGIGLLGLFLGAIRSLAALSNSTDFAFWQSKETWRQRILLGLGIATLLLLGLFPQIVQPILLTFPLVFEHLGG